MSASSDNESVGGCNDRRWASGGLSCGRESGGSVWGGCIGSGSSASGRGSGCSCSSGRRVSGGLSSVRGSGSSVSNGSGKWEVGSGGSCSGGGFSCSGGSRVSYNLNCCGRIDCSGLVGSEKLWQL